MPDEKPFPNFITQEEIHRANDAWDRENGHRDIQARYGRGWKLDENIVGEKLSDKKIAKYEHAGHYSEELKQARRDLNAKKSLRRNLTGAGHFFERYDGSLVYRL